jgi:hypothetical protein
VNPLNPWKHRCRYRGVLFWVFDKKILKFDNKPFDLVIMDMLMPGKNGGGGV